MISVQLDIPCFKANSKESDVTLHGDQICLMIFLQAFWREENFCWFMFDFSNDISRHPDISVTVTI